MEGGQRQRKSYVTFFFSFLALKITLRHHSRLAALSLHCSHMSPCPRPPYRGCRPTCCPRARPLPTGHGSLSEPQGSHLTHRGVPGRRSRVREGVPQCLAPRVGLLKGAKLREPVPPGVCQGLRREGACFSQRTGGGCLPGAHRTFRTRGCSAPMESPRVCLQRPGPQTTARDP